MKRIISAILAAVTLLVCLSAPAAADEGGYNFKFALLGDVNGDGVFDAIDYVMAKRSVLGTFTLNELQIARADVNRDGNVDAIDYAMIKRHVLGTYTIK